MLYCSSSSPDGALMFASTLSKILKTVFCILLQSQQKLKTAMSAVSASERPTSGAAAGALTPPSETSIAQEDGKDDVGVDQQSRGDHVQDDELRLRQAKPVDDAGKETQSGEAGVNKPVLGGNIKSKLKPGGGLLLELIRGFRAGMLRVDSNLRAAMFRALRYLVSVYSGGENVQPIASLVFNDG